MNFLKILLLILLLSTLSSLILVHSCSKKQVDKQTDVPTVPEKPGVPTPAPSPETKDIPVKEYLKTQKPDVGGRWKYAHARIVAEELYTIQEMPFEKGKVKFGTHGKSCLTFPVAYWEKRDEETRCVITIHFDCNGNVRSHTSECIII